MNAAAEAKKDAAPVITVQMQKILDYISEHGQITDAEIGSLLNLKKTRTFTLAKQMQTLGLIIADGRGKEKRYLRK